MYASELIKQLAEGIRYYGDKEIKICLCGDDGDYDFELSPNISFERYRCTIDTDIDEKELVKKWDIE